MWKIAKLSPTAPPATATRAGVGVVLVGARAIPATPRVLKGEWRLILPSYPPMQAKPNFYLSLILFAVAARRLTMATLGFLQYGAPIGQFLLAAFAYGEPFGTWNFVGFSFIWTALIVYTVDSLRAYRAATGTPPTAVGPHAPPVALAPPVTSPMIERIRAAWAGVNT